MQAQHEALRGAAGFEEFGEVDFVELEKSEADIKTLEGEIVALLGEVTA